MANDFVANLREQEQRGDYNFFSCRPYMTSGFMNLFSDKAGCPEEQAIFAAMMAARMLEMIREKYGTAADYLQVFDCTYGGRSETVYAIHDETHVTILLSDEY